MADIDINSLINSTIVSNTRKYWLVRSMGGQYYDDFIENGFIAIGYDEIKLSDIAKSNNGNESGKVILRDIIKTAYPKETRPNYITKHLFDFAYNIKKNDIVIVPSSSSDFISIGRIVETPVYLELDKPTDYYKCPFEKRKKVEWLKTNLLFSKLDPNLLYLKYTRRTITTIDEYSIGLIDRTISAIYVKDNDAHLSLNIQQKDSFKAVELFQTWLDLFQLAEDFGKEENINIQKEDFEIRINIQSEGTIELISLSILAIVTLSIIITALIGAEFESNSDALKFKFKSEGLIKKVTDYLNAKKERKFKEELISQVKKMEINPDELVKILEQIDRKQIE
jgi:restriction system protein